MSQNNRFDSSPSSSPQTERPTKPTSSKKIVIESSGDSSEEDSEAAAKKPPAISRTPSKNHKRRAPTYPAFTPIVPKKARRNSTPIRVNLTPDPREMPSGWLTKSQLLKVASRHNGMAVQYRVMYHTSQKPIKDHNAGATRKIRYMDAVVQSRFACASGSHGGNTYALKRWKLPGTLLQSRNAKHITIYSDTRPRLYAPGRKETEHPLIVLCSELNDADRRMAARFLRDAEAGMTPEQFCSRQHQTTRSATTTQDMGGSQARTAEPMEIGEDSPLVLQDDSDSVASEYEGESEQEAAPAKLGLASVRDDSRHDKPSKAKARPRSDQNYSSTPGSGSKRGRNDEREDRTTTRAKKKDNGGDRRRGKVTFHVGKSDSPQFLALVEGVPGVQSNTRGPEDVAQDYIRDIFMNGRVEMLPSKGRMIELPGEAKHGRWTAELVDANDRVGGSGKGMMRDILENLKDARIQLRHHSVKAMGPLILSRWSDLVSPLSYSSPQVQRIRGGGESTKKRGTGLTADIVYLIDPSHGRCHDFVSQGVVSKTVILDRLEPFVGSISIAAFDGFTSSADSRLSALQISASLLESCRKRLVAREAEGLDFNHVLEDVMAIPAAGVADPRLDLNVGVSFICKVALGESYGLLVATDEGGHIIAVDGK